MTSHQTTVTARRHSSRQSQHDITAHDSHTYDSTTHDSHTTRILALRWPTYQCSYGVVRKCLTGAWLAKTRHEYWLWLECGAMLMEFGCPHKHLRIRSSTTLADISVLLWGCASLVGQTSTRISTLAARRVNQVMFHLGFSAPSNYIYIYIYIYMP
jgi:hypothetical protein